MTMVRGSAVSTPKVLVLGGSGRVGGSVVRALVLDHAHLGAEVTIGWRL